MDSVSGFIALTPADAALPVNGEDYFGRLRRPLQFELAFSHSCVNQQLFKVVASLGQRSQATDGGNLLRPCRETFVYPRLMR